MKLTSENVEKVFEDCLLREGEDETNYTPAEGVMMNVGFHPQRLREHLADVRAMLGELPAEFHSTSGGSFLSACMTKNDVQWGEHRNVEQLMCLGLALNIVVYGAPRLFWWALPGGMPVFGVVPEESNVIPNAD